MPLCVLCSKPLICTCSAPLKLGETKVACSKTPGALWIHVLDDQGKDVKGVKVLKKGDGTTQGTNAQGLAFYESLPVGDYIAELPALESAIADVYEPPVELAKPAKVADGQIAYVSFVLTRKAKLKALVYYKYDPKRFPRRLFELASPIVTAENQSTGDAVIAFAKNGIVDVGALPAGKYEVTARFPVTTDAAKFEIATNKQTVELTAPDEKTVEFEVEPIYQTVQFIGHCLLTIPKQLHTGSWKARYNGHIEDKTDIAERMKFVKAVMERARGFADAEPTNLKVFAVPECFFQGRYGAYLSADVEDLIARLQDAVTGEEWKDWVFVFGTVNGAIGTERTVSQQDMFNMSPVIRGGHGGVEPESFTRLVQKAEFSAELIGKDEWKDEWEKMLTRPVAWNENMAFTGTENEEKFGKLLKEMLADGPGASEVLTENALTAGHWPPLKKFVEDEIAAKGLLPVVRRLRAFGMPKTAKSGKAPTLADCEFGGFDGQGVAGLERWQAFAGPLLRIKKARNVLEWKTRATREKVINEVKAALPTIFAEQKVVFSFQQDAITAGMNTLDPDEEDELGEVLDSRLDPTFTLSAIPMVRLLVELYAAKKAKPAIPPQRLAGKFDYQDYCFAMMRKAGPWMKLDAAATQPAEKKLIFGLETCADHNLGRLLNSLGAATPPPVIDIQVVPSAGSYPIDSAVVARDGGYLFNCDGWKVPSSGKKDVGMIETVTLAGRPAEMFKNPLSPHTVLGTAGSKNPTGKKVERSLTCETADTKPLDDALAEVIFGEGAGVLHVYPKKAL